MNTSLNPNEYDDTQDSFKQSPKWLEKEQQRLSDIAQYGLDNIEEEDQGLFSITSLAALITNTTMGFVSIVQDTYNNIISRFGSTKTTSCRKYSFCNIAIEQDSLFEVPDAILDERFLKSEYVKGTDKPIRYYAAYPIRSPNGNNLGTLCVLDYKPHSKLDNLQKLALKTLSDQVMTHLQLRLNNKKLQIALERAEKLYRAKDDFVSNMSHELRTPLNAINGFAEVLSNSNLEDSQKDAVSIIKSSCEILITLINDILDFSKIESGKLAIDKSPFELKKGMENIRDLLSKNAKAKDIEFNLIFDNRIPKTILGDKVRINQIIMNLIGNAIKFTKMGSVTLSVNLKDESDSQVFLDFSVKDTGVGIPEDKLESIFERFEQLGKETNRIYGGTGLGLNISKNLVGLQNGKLEVKSELGKGSDFFFTIPYDKLTEDNKTKNDTKIKKISNFESLKNIKILICEDNLINIKLIKYLLKNKPIYFEIAENGKIGIEILKSNKKFDIILMDINMPEMNGIEATQYIRNIMNLSIPIIGFSANSSVSEREICLKNGMNNYITKSFVADDFFKRLSNAIPLKNFPKDDDFFVETPKRRSFSDKLINNRTEDSFLNNKEFNLSSLVRREHSNKEIEIKKSISPNTTRVLNKKNNDEAENNYKNNSCNNIHDCFCNMETSDIGLLENDKENKKKLGKIKFPNESSEDNSDENENQIIKNLNEISGGDENFEKELLDVFLNEFPKEMKKLESAIILKDFESFKFLIHKMKTPLSMLKLNNFKDKIINIQKIFSEVENEILIKEYNEIKYDFQLKCKILKKYLKYLNKKHL